MTDETRKPEFTIRDGGVSASIWRKDGQYGDMFNTVIERTYKDKETGEWRHTNSFSGTDLLKVARIAGEAYQKEAQLKNERGRSNDISQSVNQAREAYAQQSQAVEKDDGLSLEQDTELEQ